MDTCPQHAHCSVSASRGSNCSTLLEGRLAWACGAAATSLLPSFRRAALFTTAVVSTFSDMELEEGHTKHEGTINIRIGNVVRARDARRVGGGMQGRQSCTTRLCKPAEMGEEVGCRVALMAPWYPKSCLPRFLNFPCQPTNTSTNQTPTFFAMSSGAVAGASGPVATVDAAVKAAGAKSAASSPILVIKGVVAAAAEGRVDGSTALTTNGLLGVDDAGNVTKVRVASYLRD